MIIAEKSVSISWVVTKLIGRMQSKAADNLEDKIWDMNRSQ